MNDLIVGSWRNGLELTTLTFVNEAMNRRDKGFRLLPYESTVVELGDLLDGYDDLAAELLTEEPKSGKVKKADTAAA